MSTNIFGTQGSCTCGFADVSPELPCEVHPPKCRHGIAYREPCEQCELAMIRDVVDARLEKQHEL